jgi:hypothetical protein
MNYCAVRSPYLTVSWRLSGAETQQHLALVAINIQRKFAKNKRIFLRKNDSFVICSKFLSGHTPPRGSLQVLPMLGLHRCDLTLPTELYSCARPDRTIKKGASAAPFSIFHFSLLYEYQLFRRREIPRRQPRQVNTGGQAGGLKSCLMFPRLSPPLHQRRHQPPGVIINLQANLA